MKRLEVLHILGTAASEGTSIARIVSTLAAELDPARFRLTAWFLGCDGPLRAELEKSGVATMAFNWHRGAKDPLGAWRFHKVLAGQHFDIVHQHQGARSVRWLMRRHLAPPIVVHLHGAVTRPDIAVSGADAVIAGSRWIADQVPGRSEVVYPGIRVPPGSRERTGSVVGMATRLVDGKGLLEMLSVLPSDARLEIAGDGPLREELALEIHARGLEMNVELLRWQTDLTPLFQKWSIFAMPSTNEGFGMAALEAMAHGLPVVGIRSGALPELIVDGETGLLSPADDLPTIEKNIRLLLEDPDLRARLGRAARERVARHFRPEPMAALTAAIYERLFASRNQGL